MPGADASNFTRFKKFNAISSAQSSSTGLKSTNRSSQFGFRVSGVSTMSAFMPQVSKLDRDTTRGKVDDIDPRGFTFTSSGTTGLFVMSSPSLMNPIVTNGYIYNLTITTNPNGYIYNLTVTMQANTSVRISNITPVTSITPNFSINTINISDLPNVANINWRSFNTSISIEQSITLSNLPKLYNITISEFPRLTSVSLSNLPILFMLEITKNGVTSLSLSGLPNLYRAICDFNPLTSLSLSNLPKLERLDCQYTNMQNFNFSDTSLTKLKEILCEFNKLNQTAVNNAIASLIPRLPPASAGTIFIDRQTDTTVTAAGISGPVGWTIVV